MATSRSHPCSLLLLVSALAVGCQAPGPEMGDLPPRLPAELPSGQLPEIAFGTSGPEADAAIGRLRAMGREGLQLLLAHPAAQALLREERSLSADAGNSKKGSERDAPAFDPTNVRHAIDRVAAQRDAHATGLFWHVSLDEARHRAQHEGKPILSLRLLGRLDEELSCANSRFFRTVLYPNEAVRRELQDHFVLHWESVRPVPKLTVDFGDGRMLETTITGNSIHYVLMPDGQPIDALPGLWGSRAFLAEIQRDRALAAELQAMSREQREPRLRAWHEQRIEELRAELAADAERLDEREKRILQEQLARTGGGKGAPVDDIVFTTGSFVSFPAGTKITAELPLIGSIIPDVEGMRGRLPDEVWSALARLRADESALDESSRAVVRAKELGRARRSSPGLDGENDNENERERLRMDPLFERLQRSISEDTVRNRHLIGARLHEWFASGQVPDDVGLLNERVYRELFMSPVNDAWLGLVPPDAYAGLDNAGRKGKGSDS